jgi:predicted CxxxxCH...CXXCH cytochrome family protein
VAGDGFDTPALHINGTLEVDADSCVSCHTGDIDGALAGVHGSHTDTAAFLAGKTVSGGGNGGAGWYTTSWTNGQPSFGCGECHPTEGVSHPINGLNVDVDPAGESPTAGSPKLKNAAQSVAITSRSSVTCSSVYCHSSGETSPAYQTSPDWYGGSISGNCNDCHGNAPSTGTHSNHLVGIHYETLYDGASGLMSSGGASAAAHGDAASSDTIGCQTCHNNTVSVTVNDQNSICATCHDGGTAPLQGNMAINTGGSTHLNTQPDVVFDTLSSYKSRAQLRDDITTVTELNDNWTRNGGYKAAGSFDQMKVATPSYAGGACSNVSCHNGITTPTWTTGFAGDCSKCHTSLPQ